MVSSMLEDGYQCKVFEVLAFIPSLDVIEESDVPEILFLQIVQPIFVVEAELC